MAFGVERLIPRGISGMELLKGARFRTMVPFFRYFQKSLLLSIAFPLDFPFTI
jgi:hypothetical protein